MCIRYFVIILVVVVGTAIGSAQVEYATWIFGRNAGISFDGGSGVPLATPRVVQGLPMDALEGTASYRHPCDTALSLYAMGEVVYDGAGNILPNGTGLSGGTSSTQGGIFVRDPSRPRSVYLFVTPDLTDVSSTITNQYTYTRCERTETGPWVIVEKNVQMDPRTGSERIASTHDATRNGFWVVLQFSDTAAREIELAAYHVGPSGLDPTPVISRFPLSTFIAASGQMKFDPAGTELLIVNTDNPIILAYAFDRVSGRFSNPRAQVMPPPDNWASIGHAYGITYTGTGRYIYVTVRGIRSDGEARMMLAVIVPRFLGDPTFIITEVSSEPVTRRYPYALQLGPNGSIYITNGTHLGVVPRPEQAPYEHDMRAIALAPGRAHLGLPTCMESAFTIAPSTDVCAAPTGVLSVPGTACVGDCVPMGATSTGSVNTWEWTFEGGVPNVWNGATPPSVCYPSGGRYAVRLVLTGAGGRAELWDTIIVEDLPTLRVPSRVDLCVGDSVGLTATSDGVAVRWEPDIDLSDARSFTPMCTPSTSRTYRVTVRSAGGCERVDSVQVNVLPPQRVQISAPAVVEVLIGEAFSIPIVINGMMGERVTMSIVPGADLLIAPPYNAPVERILTSASDTVLVEATAFLARDTLRPYTLSVTPTGSCLQADTTVGLVDADACGLPLRAVRIGTAMPRLTRIGATLRAHCAGPFTVRLVGLRGETLVYAAGTDVLDLQLPEAPQHMPLFAVVTWQNTTVAMIVRGE